MAPLRIAFIGAGNMALALGKGMVAAGIASPKNIIASSPKSDQILLDRMKDMGCRTTYDNREAVVDADVSLIAVKPNVMELVLSEVKDLISGRGPLVASVAMGVSVESMERTLGPTARVVRCMPNTPALVQEGASVFCRGTQATEEDALMAQQLLSGVGDCHEVPESYLNAVTGLSGAGPAYVYMMIEALADGGVQNGLPRGLAMKLAAKTLLGGARMILNTDQHPGVLKDAVCSPGGCTIAGVAALEASGVRGALMRAVQEATNRSKHLEQNT